MSQQDRNNIKKRLDDLYKRGSSKTSSEFQYLLAQYLSEVNVEELDRQEYLGVLDLGYAWDGAQRRYRVDLIKQTIQNGYYRVIFGEQLRAFNQIVLTVIPQLPVSLLPEITNYIRVYSVHGKIEIIQQRPHLAIDYLIGVSYYLEYIKSESTLKKGNFGITPQYIWSRKRILEELTAKHNLEPTKLVNKRVPTSDDLDILKEFIQTRDSRNISAAYRVMMMNRLLTEDDPFYDYDEIYNVLESADGDPHLYLIYIVQGYLGMDGGDLYYLERIIDECADIGGLIPYKDQILPYLLDELGRYLNKGVRIPNYLTKMVNRLYVECGWHKELAHYIN